METDLGFTSALKAVPTVDSVYIGPTTTKHFANEH